MERNRIEIRVTAEYKELLVRKANKFNMSLSEYIKSCIDVDIQNKSLICDETFYNIPFDNVKLSLPNKENLKSKAKDLGFSSLSEYVRALIFNRKIIPKTDINSLFQLRKIGVNINQIAHSLNANPLREFKDSDRELLNKLEKMLSDLSDKIQNFDK